MQKYVRLTASALNSNSNTVALILTLTNSKLYVSMLLSRKEESEFMSLTCLWSWAGFLQVSLLNVANMFQRTYIIFSARIL